MVCVCCRHPPRDSIEGYMLQCPTCGTIARQWYVFLSCSRVDCACLCVIAGWASVGAVMEGFHSVWWQASLWGANRHGPVAAASIMHSLPIYTTLQIAHYATFTLIDHDTITVCRPNGFLSWRPFTNLVTHAWWASLRVKWRCPSARVWWVGRTFQWNTLTMTTLESAARLLRWRNCWRY